MDVSMPFRGQSGFSPIKDLQGFSFSSSVSDKDSDTGLAGFAMRTAMKHGVSLTLLHAHAEGFHQDANGGNKYNVLDTTPTTMRAPAGGGDIDVLKSKFLPETEVNQLCVEGKIKPIDFVVGEGGQLNASAFVYCSANEKLDDSEFQALTLAAQELSKAGSSCIEKFGLSTLDDYIMKDGPVVETDYEEGGVYGHIYVSAEDADKFGLPASPDMNNDKNYLPTRYTPTTLGSVAEVHYTPEEGPPFHMDYE